MTVDSVYDEEGVDDCSYCGIWFMIKDSLLLHLRDNHRAAILYQFDPKLFHLRFPYWQAWLLLFVAVDEI